MNEHEPSPLDTVVCGRCAAVCDFDDNFCRECGLSLHSASTLPSVRASVLPAIRQPSVQATVARGAAFVAAGKIAEVVVRRLVRSAFQRGNGSKNLPANVKKGEIIPHDEALPAGAGFISETLLMRRVRIRR